MNGDIVVLIPHYNNIEGLRRSLASIKFPSKIDVLIVDDGSFTKPGEEAFMRDFGQNLKLHFLYNEQNLGIETTLNSGLIYIQKKTTCRYIARLDCGDICAPDRFLKQKEYLDAHEKVFLVGSWVNFFYDEKIIYTYKAPSRHQKIVNNMYLKCSFIHPSVMFRAEALNQIGLYPTQYKAAEDYAFFFKFVKTYQTYIFPEALTSCELNPKGISRTKRAVQQKNKIKIILENRTFSPYFFLGLLRSYIMLLLPYSIVAKAKEVLLK